MGFEKNLHWNDWQKLKNMDFHWNFWEILIEQKSFRLTRDSLRGYASCTRASLESARRQQCHLGGILQVASLAGRVTFSKDYQIRWFVDQCAEKVMDERTCHHSTTCDLRLETSSLSSPLAIDLFRFRPWCNSSCHGAGLAMLGWSDNACVRITGKPVVDVALWGEQRLWVWFV